MRLQVVISEMGVGGAEKMVVENLRDGAAHGDELALLGAPGQLDEELRELSIRRQSLPTSRSLPGLLRSLGIVARFTRGFRPDVIHSHNVRVTAVARFGSQLALPAGRPPLLTTYHGVPLEEEEQAAKLLRLADLVVCVSEDLKGHLEEKGFPPHKLAVIPNGVPDPVPLSGARRAQIDAELGLDEEAEVVSIVGRLVPQKAHERFLEAAAAVKEQRPRARFLVVGDGERRAELEALAAQHNLGSSLLFTGIRPDAADVIARSDLLVFSSVWEGLSIAALEALARGIPVVSTDVAGAQELLTTGAGVIVPQDATALGEAIAAALADPAARERMGTEGRRLHAERFSVARMNAGYRELYEQLQRR
ncbi:MAG TPA: glycosyltransferase [Solirubrobacterales bacterium]|nr:glycosyltransferase [Solirubrobacterales bacterium]